MTTSGIRRLLLFAAALWLSQPEQALAQSPTGLAPRARPERPYRGLFGGGQGDTAQSLTFDGSIGGYQELVAADRQGRLRDFSEAAA